MFAIIFNGKPLMLDKPMTLATCLQMQNYHSDDFAVALNRAFVPRLRYASTHLHPDDEIETVTMMQGG